MIVFLEWLVEWVQLVGALAGVGLGIYANVRLDRMEKEKNNA